MSDLLHHRYSARTGVSNNASLPALRRNLGTVLAVALLLTAVAPGLAGQESTPRLTVAARGAGATVAEGLGCVPYLVEPFKPAGYYDTVWPSEHRDPWRTHAAVGGCRQIFTASNS